MVVRVTANLGDTLLSPDRGEAPRRSERGEAPRFAESGYYLRRLSSQVRFARLDWIATARRLPRLLRGDNSSAQYRGLLFERSVSDCFAARYGSSWLGQPYFWFRERSGVVGAAIPDGMLVSPEEILVVEIKYNLRAEDFAQLEEFYLPIVGRAFPSRLVSGLLVCRHVLDREAVREDQCLTDIFDLGELRGRYYTQVLLLGMGLYPLRDRGRE